MREMIERNLSTLFFLRDQVADAADGVHLNPSATLGGLLTQAMYIPLYGVRGDIVGMSEDVVLDLFLGDDPALAAHQQFEHRGLARAEQLGLAVDGGLTILRVEGEIGNAQARAEQL